MFPPAVELGAFEFTAFWLLNAAPAAHWFVSAFWTPSWNPPAPPEPAERPSSWPLLQPQPPPPLLPPISCSAPCSGSVLALLLTPLYALDVAVCVAALRPA